MKRATVKQNQYQDSVRLMTISREASALPGVAKVLALLGTESNKRVVEKLGLLDAEVDRATANDLLVCVEASDEAACAAAVAKVDALLRRDAGASAEVANPTSVEEARERLPDATFALISVPGPFAKLDVVAALESGLDVMLFSDNIGIEDEVELKQLALSKDLLLMGPDCGTAIVNGVPLAFSNVIRRGEIGVVAASGTGIQEVTCLIDRFGGGISHAIGVGGRDLKKKVGGKMMRKAIRDVAADPATRRLLLLWKPGDPGVTQEVLDEAAATGLEVVACILGGGQTYPPRPGLTLVGTLEEGAMVSLGRKPAAPDLGPVLAAARPLSPGRRFLRALYSGGTLAYEALLLADGVVPVESNIATRPELRLAYPADGKAHCCVDMGEDEFTQGIPHPMIDLSQRQQRMLKDLRDPTVKVLLLDVVLGYGTHPDPAPELVATIEEGRAGIADGGPVVIGHVCGAQGDPQSLEAQEAALRAGGVFTFPTNAQAARAALALVS